MIFSAKLALFHCFLSVLIALGSSFYMTDLWQKKEDMFKKVNLIMKRVELILDMRSNFRNMTISSRNMVLVNNDEKITDEWLSILEQREFYMRNRKLLVENINTDLSKSSYSTINEILEIEDLTLNTILKSGRLVLDKNHEEAITYIMGYGRENQRVMFNLLTKLSDEEEFKGKKIINNYREGTTKTIIVISFFFVINFIILVAMAFFSFVLVEKIENRK